MDSQARGYRWKTAGRFSGKLPWKTVLSQAVKIHLFGRALGLFPRHKLLWWSQVSSKPNNVLELSSFANLLLGIGLEKNCKLLHFSLWAFSAQISGWKAARLLEINCSGTSLLASITLPGPAVYVLPLWFSKLRTARRKEELYTDCFRNTLLWWMGSESPRSEDTGSQIFKLEKEGSPSSPQFQRFPTEGSTEVLMNRAMLNKCRKWR